MTPLLIMAFLAASFYSLGMIFKEKTMSLLRKVLGN